MEYNDHMPNYQLRLNICIIKFKQRWDIYMVMEIAGNNDGSIGDYIIIEYAECGPHKKLLSIWSRKFGNATQILLFRYLR